MRRFLLIFIFTGLGLIAGCQKADKTTASSAEQAPAEPASAANEPMMNEPATNTIDLVARGTHFEGPHSVDSGWVTIVFHNQSSMTHFALVEKMPEGVTKEDRRAAGKIFQDAMDLINQGDAEAGMKRLGDLPDTGQKIVYTGGPGFIGPGRSSRTTLYLTPGHYMIECYVKTDGRFHSYSPDPNEPVMDHELTVTDVDGGAPEPSPTVSITLSSDQGIEAEDSFPAGPQTVAVHFADQKVYGNFVGHDLHLAALNGAGDTDAIAAWMNWLDPKGLETPAPVTFLGGTNEAPAGSTVYFDVNLKPGRYAWVSEVPNPDQHKLLKTFTVSAPPAD